MAPQGMMSQQSAESVKLLYHSQAFIIATYQRFLYHLLE